MAEVLATHKKSLEIITKDLLIRYQHKPLPEALGHFLKNAQDRALVNNSPAANKMILKSIAKDLRRYCQEHNIYLEHLNKEDLLLIETLENLGLPYMKKNFSGNFQEYKKDLENRKKLLAKLCTRPEFIKEYFEYTYIDQKEGFLYQPHNYGLVHLFLSLYHLPVQVWEQKEGLEPTLVEQFNVEKYHKIMVRNLLYFNEKEELGFTPFQSFSPSAKEIPQLKNNLKAVLKDIITDSSLGDFQKIQTLDYFLTKDAMLADYGMERLVKARAAEAQIQLIWQQLPVNEHFFNQCLGFVLAKMHNELIETPELTKDKALFSTNISNWTQQYLSTQLTKDYQSLPELKRNVLQVDTHNYWLINNAAGFKLCSQAAHCYYVEDNIDQTLVLKHKNTSENEKSFWDIAGISVNDFQQTLKEAFKDADKRKTLFAEIEHYVIKLLDSRLPENGDLLTEEVKQAFITNHALDKEIKMVIADFNRRFSPQPLCKSLTDCINCYNLLPTKDFVPAYLQKLLDYVSQGRVLFDNILQICINESICNHYLDACLKVPAGISRGLLWVYAHQKGVALNIYQRDLAKASPCLYKDEHYTRKGNKQSLPTLHLIYDALSNTFTVLEPANQSLSPEALWSGYTKELQLKVINKVHEIFADEKTDIKRVITSLQTPVPQLKNLNIIQDQHMEHLMQLRFEKAILEGEQQRRELMYKSMRWLDKYLVKQTKGEVSVILGQALLVNEPLDQEQQTLLDFAIEHGNSAVINYLLSVDASLVTESYPACSLEILLQDNVCPLPPTKNTYVLQKGSQALDEWRLFFVDNKGIASEIVTNISGLKNKLQHYPPDLNASFKMEVKALIVKNYHNIMQRRTPLTTAAKRIGFQKNSTLFQDILLAGIKEAEAARKQELEGFDRLIHLSKVLLTAKISKHLEDYTREKQESVNNQWDWVWELAAGWDLQWLKSQNRTSQRSEELAKMILSLIRNEKDLDYTQMIKDFKALYTNGYTASLFSSNRLFNDYYKETLKTAKDYLQTENDWYKEQRRLYQEQYGSKIPLANSSSSRDDDINQLKIENREIKEQSAKDKAEAEAKRAADKAESDARIAKLEALILAKQATPNAVGGAVCQRVNDPKNKAEALDYNPPPLIASRKALKLSTPIEMPKQLNQTPTYSCGVSAGFFSYSLLARVQEIPEALKIQLKDSLGLNIDTWGGSFFEIVAAEIGRIEKDDFTELDLRKRCANYAKGRNLEFLKGLYKTAQAMDMVLLNRDDYAVIECNSEMARRKKVYPIEGVSCIEGVLLAKEFNAVLCEVSIKDKPIYNIATSKRFLSNISEEEFKGYLDQENVLLIMENQGQFYQLLKKMDCTTKMSPLEF